MTDPAWSAYCAVATLQGTEALNAQGVAELPACGPLTLEAPPAGQQSHALPPYTMPENKNAKAMEEAPSAGTCMWATAGSCVHGVALRFTAPVVPPWRPPPPPPRPLDVLVQERWDGDEAATPYVDPHAATDAFQEQVQQMVRALVALQLGPGGTGPTDVASLKTALQKDGRLKQMREALKERAVAVVVEKYHRGLDGRPLEQSRKAQLLDDLHVHLSSAAGEAVAALQQKGGAGGGNGVTGSRRERFARLAALADECELQGAVKRAEQLHQDRVVVGAEVDQEASAAVASGGVGVEAQPSAQAQALYGYATFCTRRGPAQQGRAEAALKRALSLDPSHAPAMGALSAVLLHQGRATDPWFLREAAEVARTLIAVAEGGTECVC